jgi:hypothetical protein
MLERFLLSSDGAFVVETPEITGAISLGRPKPPAVDERHGWDPVTRMFYPD